MEDNDERTGLEIAIIGMVGRFPGARDIATFWKNLLAGEESISFLSDQEMAELNLADQYVNDPNYINVKGGILDDSDYFDASFFGYLPAEVEIMDPQMRLFHECAWEALEDAGYEPESYNGLIGVYGGAGDHFHWEALTTIASKGDLVDSFSAVQLNDKDFLSTHVSFRLNLKGPAITLHTACSTSLVAVDQAYRGLLSGLCDMALAGGVAVNTRKRTGFLYREGTILSPDGHCRAFDEKAAGTVFGEGVGIVVLKRLEEAIEDGDHIYCMVKGSAINNDGIRKAGFSAPSIEGQAEVIRAALQMAEVSPGSIGYIETHGTGTSLGDSVEIEGLKLAFNTEQRNYCAIGSVKCNVGHLDTAAGVTGLIKTVLALKHRIIPPSINFKSPNPAIDFENSPFFVNAELRQWQRNGYPLRAGVSSFGIGGTNAHVVLEEAPQQGDSSRSRSQQIILLSARTPSALEKATENFTGYLRDNPGHKLADVAYTLQRGRKAFRHRKMLVCAAADEAISALSADDKEKVKTFFVRGDEQYVVFMFSGQGAQYENMGLDLYKKEPCFREEMDRCFDILSGLVDYNMREILYPAKMSDLSDLSGRNIDQTEIAQPLLFIIEYALAKLLIEWGIEPRGMIGHSIGEYVAACLAGVFSLEDALRLVVLRGRLMQKMPGGSMLSIPLAEEELVRLLDSEPGLNREISLAAVNGPARCVVSGPSGAIEAFAGQLNGAGYKSTRLHTSHAFHSMMMDPLLGKFEEAVRQIDINKPRLPYLSNLTGSWISGEEVVEPGYWSGQLRETVRFSEGIKELLKMKNPIFIEVGPGNMLSTLVRGHKDSKVSLFTLNMVRHPREEVADDYFLLEKIGQLWLWGISIDWKGYYGCEWRHRLSLPTYPFERKRYRIEGDLYDLTAKMLSGTALVKKPDIADWFYAPFWQQSLLPIKSFCGGPGGSFLEKNPLVAEGRKWLVFLDKTGFGTRLVRQLEQSGQEITVVRTGEEFRRENDNSFEFILNPGQADAYDKLFSELGKLNRLPGRILHMWNVDRDSGGNGRVVLDNLEASQEIGFYSLLNLVRAVGRQAITGQMEVTVVTTGMHRVFGEELIKPEKATIQGAVKIIPLEYSNINCRSIDIVLADFESEAEEQLAEMLLDELFTEMSDMDRDRVIAYRGLSRWVPVHRPVRLESFTGMDHRLRDRGVYMITGGFGGMGFTIAGYLAETYRARLILVGRSVFPGEGEWEEWLNAHGPEDGISQKIRKIRDWQQQGAEIMVVSADVSDYQRMGEVFERVKQRFGHINGVLHTAGLADYGGVIQKRTREITETVIAPKVRGTLVLDALLDYKTLDFFILFSSVGNVLYKIKFGEVGYVAGNEFLEAFANYKASGNGTFTFIAAINWTDWLEVGMSIEAARRKYGGNPGDIDYEAESFDSVTPGQGVEVFRRILGNRFHRISVATKDLNRMLEYLFRPRDRKTNVTEEIEETEAAGELDSRPELSTGYEAPRSQVEKQLARLFQQYFGIASVGIYDDFFELGGDSLKALNVATRIHRLLNVEITLPVFFSTPNIAGLAGYISKAKKSEFYMVRPAEEKEYYPLSSAQTRFYILQQIDAECTIYNMPKVMTFRERLEKDTLERAFRDLVLRHESLRTYFRVIDGKPKQVIDKQVNFEIEFYDLGAGSNQAGTGINALIGNFVRVFDLSQSPLIRARLIRTVQNVDFLLVDMHHLVSDMFSLIILETDFLALYKRQEPAPLKLQYKDYAEWQNHEKQTPRIKTQEEFWCGEFSGRVPVLNLPFDFPRPETQSFEGHTIGFRIGNDETAALKKIAVQQDATLFMVLLALECVWLSKLSGQEDIVIGAPLAGRSHPDLEKMIGVFLNTIALRNFPRGSLAFIEFLAEVRVRALKAFENQDYCFEDLVDALEIQRDMGRNPLFDAAINFYNFEEKEKAADGSELEEYDEELRQILSKYGSDIAHNDLMLYLEEDGAGLLLSLEYCTKLFKQETIQRFIKYFYEIVAHVIENESIKLADINISHELIKSESGILEEDLEDFDI